MDSRHKGDAKTRDFNFHIFIFRRVFSVSCNSTGCSTWLGNNIQDEMLDAIQATEK